MNVHVIGAPKVASSVFLIKYMYCDECIIIAKYNIEQSNG